MIALELLLISRVLDGGRQAVLLYRVDVRASSRFGFVLVVVLDARSTKSYVRWQDCFPESLPPGTPLVDWPE